MRRNDWLAIGILLAIALGLVFLIWQGPDLSFDDANYILFSHQMLNGTYNITESPYAYGSFFIGTLALSAQDPSLPGIMELCLLIACTYLICLKLYGTKIAFVTSLCLELSVWVFIYASRALPDMLLGLLIAIVFLIYTYKPDKLAWRAAAGFVAGFTIFVKWGGFILLLLLLPTVVPYFNYAVLIGFMIIALASRKHASFLFGLGIAVFLYSILLPSGASIPRMAQAYSATQAKLSSANLVLNMETIVVLLFWYGSVQSYSLGGFIFFVIFGTALIIKHRKWEYTFAILGFWLSFLYLFFGTESFTNYIFVTVVSRYFVAFVAPMAILGGYFVNWLYAHTRFPLFYGGNLVLIMLVLAVFVTNVGFYLLFYINPNIHYTFKPPAINKSSLLP